MLEIKRMTNNRDALGPRTVIIGYEFDTTVGGGGFGVVCRRRYMLLREFVAIKEYFPLDLAVRRSDGVYPRDYAGSHSHEGLRRFVDEVRILGTVSTVKGTGVASLGFSRSDKASNPVRNTGATLAASTAAITAATGRL